MYRDHRGWLLAWLRRNVACPQRAEDLSQDTFVRLLNRDELLTPREPRAFLVAIAYHAFTWFKLFPLTMPPIIVNGKRLEPEVVVGSGWTAAILAALALLGIVWRIAA